MSSFDLYQTVTDQIVTMLEAGVVPWRSPILGRSRAGHPKNLNTGKQYRGEDHPERKRRQHLSLEFGSPFKWHADEAEKFTGHRCDFPVELAQAAAPLVVIRSQLPMSPIASKAEDFNRQVS